jgi:hypothetical protein
MNAVAKNGETPDAMRVRTRAELVHLIRKLRWMGMDDEAMRMEAALAGTSGEEPVLAAEVNTD